MQMILNNGMVINDVPDMPEKVRKHLNQFWHFPSQEEIKKKKEQYYNFDYKREIHRRSDQTESDINP